jgi:putative phosphoesterase
MVERIAARTRKDAPQFFCDWNAISMSANVGLRVGLISDTHGLLRPEARAFAAGCDYIIHGGDIGSAAILEELSALAPLIAVKGNNDLQAWAAHLPQTETIRVGGVFIYVIHDISQLDIEPRAAGVQVVVSGHSHKPLIEFRDGILYVNPGSCGPRRFNLPLSVGEILVAGTKVKARTVEFVPAAR